MREPDIIAPDGYLLGGLRRVRNDGTLLFHRVYWECPKEWIGKQIWVHVTDGITLNEIKAAPPGQHIFMCHFRDRVLLEPANKPNAKSVFKSDREIDTSMTDTPPRPEHQYSPLSHWPIEDRHCECGDCEWTGYQSDIEKSIFDCNDLSERLDVGHPLPAGECPTCGAWAYVVTPYSRLIDAAESLHRALEPFAVLFNDKGGWIGGPEATKEILRRTKLALAEATYFGRRR